MEFFELCKRIGIETLGDLRKFKKEEQQKGETMLQTLERYFYSLGKDFEVKE